MLKIANPKPGEKADPPAPAAEIVPFPRVPLKADIKEMRRFVNAVFRACSGIEGWIALRALEHEGDGRAVLNLWIKPDDTLVPKAAEAATAIANRNFDERAVFAPPVCVFASAEKATEANVSCAPVIVVDLDERPSESLAFLSKVLGDPTIIVATGGQWRGPDGVFEDKLHLYWRLRQPATTADEKARLKRARAAATRLVGADATAVALNHPMRWPGSWHTKGVEVRLCRIVGGDAGKAVDLAWAAEELQRALRLAGAEVDGDALRSDGRAGFKTSTPLSAAALADAARLIPNEGLPWDRWNAIGMAMWDASHASVDGLEAFHTWSEKDARYDADRTDARWSHWSTSPPSNLSSGTLLREMRKVDPQYRIGFDVGEHFEAPPETSAPRSDPDGPHDIFGDADPAELSTPPAGSLPELLSRWARSEARRKGAPEAWAAMSALTAVGAAIGVEVRMQVRQNDESWTEGANLWTAIVADPGRAKSPIIASALSQHRKTDAGWLKNDLARHAEWHATNRKKAKDALPAGREPRIRRALVDDVTAEKAIRIFADNPNGVLRAPDELVGMLESFGAYKKSGGGDRSQFLRFFDGGPVTIDRVGSGTIAADRATLSILAGTQPAKMAEIAKNLGDDGLLQRFIFILDDGADREPIDEAPDAEAQDAYARMIVAFLEADHRFFPTIRMAPAAAAHFKASWQLMRRLKQAPGVGAAFGGHIEKWGKILPRIILAMHAVRQFEHNGAIDPNALVDVDTVDMAVRFARFILRHSIRFYDTYFGAPVTTTEARWLAGFLLSRPDLETIRRRDVYDARTSLRGPENSPAFRMLTASMGELEGAGWCHVTERNAAGPTAWSIDRRIHVRFAERGEREKRERALRRAKIAEAGASRSWIDTDAEIAMEVGVGPSSIFD